ncbi:MAG: hypothetical protein ACR2IY_06950 [Rubrivivax sp.]
MSPRPPSNKGKRLIKINAISQAQVIKLMLDGELSCVELAEETGLHYVTVLQYARELHLAKAAHICRWEKDARGRDAVKIYKLGPGKDAKRERISDAERQARYKAKLKSQKMAQVMGGKARFVQAGNGRLRFETVS